jgi:hypothetical protein
VSKFGARPLRLRELLLGCAIFAVIGIMVMIYLHGSGLTSRTKYHGDLTQSPHWVAYHGDAFAKDDLLVKYATYNETPIQNAIYWVGTWFVDIVPLNKIVGIAVYGLTAALFFWLVSSMAGPWTGVLASMFFVIFPRSSYEIAGGFSKAWAIGFVLVAVYVVEKRTWWILLWVMPLAALAYPMSAVLIGAIVLVGIVLEFPRSVGHALRGLKYLAAGSALALVPLLYKYFTPPAWIGEMIPTRIMRAMWEKGMSSEATLPLWKEVLGFLKHPFFIYSTVLIFMLLCRRGLVWKRSWSALVIASVVCYFAADLVVPRLYLPNRYIRYSMAVLLILWNAHNWSRVLEVFRHRWVRRTALAAVVVFAGANFPHFFRPCEGQKSLGRWENRDYVKPLSRAIAALPQPVLVAGHPSSSADVMIQARRPVLVIELLFHHWFDDYRLAIDTRTRDIFRALYARNVDQVNRLYTRYGVTHLVVPKRCYGDVARLTGDVYRSEYNEFIVHLMKGKAKFVVYPPPRHAVLFEDAYYWLVRLPLKEPGPSANATTGPMPEPSSKGER